MRSLKFALEIMHLVLVFCVLLCSLAFTAFSVVQCVRSLRVFIQVHSGKVCSRFQGPVSSGIYCVHCVLWRSLCAFTQVLTGKFCITNQWLLCFLTALTKPVELFVDCSKNDSTVLSRYKLQLTSGYHRN